MRFFKPLFSYCIPRIPYSVSVMNTLFETTTAGAQSIPKTKRNDNLSTDGKWRSFPKVPNLLQYVVAGTYYARCKVNGKPVRAALETDVFTTAKIRLPDKLKELRKPKTQVGTFADGRIKYETETSNGYTSRKNRLVKLAPLSIAYRLRCLECLRRSLVECLFHPNKTWKEFSEQARKDAFAKLDAMKASDFKKEHCEVWQARYSNQYSPSVFNNTVNTFRRVLELAGLPHDDNRTYKIGRMDILEKPIRLPSPEQFDRIITLAETSGAAQAKDCANLIRFLAFTGTRISEAKQAVWTDVDLQDNTLEIRFARHYHSSSGRRPRTRTDQRPRNLGTSPPGATHAVVRRTAGEKTSDEAFQKICFRRCVSCGA
jgi:hypothetical protein